MTAAVRTEAALLLYDGLDYTPIGSDLTSNNGGSSGGGASWDGAWAVGENNGNPEVTQVIAGGLSYGSLVSEGNASEDNVGNDSLGNARPFTGVSTSDGTSLWFSSLIDPTATDNKLYNGWFTNESKLNGDDGFGWIFEPVNDTSATITPYISAEGSASSVFSYGIDDAILVVGRIDFSDTADSDDLRLWIDPTIGGAAPSDASATASFLGGEFVDGGSFFAVGANNGGEAVFDEFRLGNTFSDVTPVPEPHSAALLLVAGALLLVRRRRLN